MTKTTRRTLAARPRSRRSRKPNRARSLTATAGWSRNQPPETPKPRNLRGFFHPFQRFVRVRNPRRHRSGTGGFCCQSTPCSGPIVGLSSRHGWSRPCQTHHRIGRNSVLGHGSGGSAVWPGQVSADGTVFQFPTLGESSASQSITPSQYRRDCGEKRAMRWRGSVTER